jgi:hypothetical protein
MFAMNIASRIMPCDNRHLQFSRSLQQGDSQSEARTGRKHQRSRKGPHRVESTLRPAKDKPAKPASDYPIVPRSRTRFPFAAFPGRSEQQSDLIHRPCWFSAASAFAVRLFREPPDNSGIGMPTVKCRHVTR